MLGASFISGTPVRNAQPSLLESGGLRGAIGRTRLTFGMAFSSSYTDQNISLDDVRIVREMAAGKTEALTRFYDRWSADVYAIAIAIVRVAQDAEEVVEDAFWQAWNQASRFDASRGQVRPWIVNIARSRALDRLKSVNRRREDELESASPAKLASPETADEMLITEERTTQVRRALHALPAPQRKVVEMAYYGGLSQTEIAACTGEPIGTIKTRTRLGMQKLRESMAGIREDIS